MGGRFRVQGPRHLQDLPRRQALQVLRIDLFRLIGFEETPAWIITSEQVKDYYRRRGHEAYGFLRLGHRAQLGLTWRSDELESLDVHSDGVLFLNKTPDPNQPIDDGTLRSGIVTLRWANRADLFGDSRRREREGFLVRNLYDTRMEEGQDVRACAHSRPSAVT